MLPVPELEANAGFRGGVLNVQQLLAQSVGGYIHTDGVTGSGPEVTANLKKS